MTNRFLMSAAVAALIAGTGFANAQGTGMSREAPSAGSTVQQNAPSADRAAPSASTPMNRDSGSTPMNRDGASESKGGDQGMKATQSDEKMPQGTKSQRAQDDMKPGMKGEKSAQDNNMKGEKSKSMSSETNEKGAAGKDMKAEGRGADGKSATTTGQAGAGAKLSTEQRTKITTIIKQQKVERLEPSKLNISISVGTRIPGHVRYYPLPQEVYVIYPEWRGYDYIYVGDQIVVVDPRTHEIVAILEA